MMYIKNPNEIEKRSFEIIMPNLKFTHGELELPVVLRAIHTTGDYEYENILRFKKDAVEVGIKALKEGCKIFTDTRMAYSGINKRTLESINCSIDCFVDNPLVFQRSKEEGITRSMAAVDIAAQNGVDIFVIGNAPTALFRIIEHIKNGTLNPKLIIGVPVGFVGAAESKEELRKIDVPSISTVGTKGGSNVAAAILNAIQYLAVERCL
ncbi:Cobalt-precorrin-8X methylmutase [Caloramator mitchellensis]|uniref:Cobalt-precorrin-8X methylmutase n=1 Tax=Caloramator mitchellensis TaxID=908809 RepID=A0A0R3K0X0_CALMK|nr:precorrin-8X methylmutase [Caloramator mitchellensis]KRQ85919.1 Cobalt-precorrin-8X methylmutase [Caloramator mitchellensis]